jgi:hypothetical protein
VIVTSAGDRGKVRVRCGVTGEPLQTIVTGGYEVLSLVTYTPLECEPPAPRLVAAVRLDDDRTRLVVVDPEAGTVVRCFFWEVWTARPGSICTI